MNTAGAGFVLSARLVTADSGNVLAAHRETAADSTEVIAAIDRLSKALRGRIGESLKTIRRNEPLASVTTGSLEALRKYSQAVRALEELDYDQMIALLDEAIQLDTAFAMAHRLLGIALGNLRRDPATRMAALTKAYEHRDRLTDRERYHAIAAYASARGETEQAIQAYRTLLRNHPNDTRALNNLGVQYHGQRNWAEAEELYRRTMALEPTSMVLHHNMLEAQVAQGKFDEAEHTMGLMLDRFPTTPATREHRGALAAARGDYRTAEERFRALAEEQRVNPGWQARSSLWLYRLARLEGRLADAERYAGERMRIAEARGLDGDYLSAAVDLGWVHMERLQPAAAIRVVDRALAEHPLESIEFQRRSYFGLAILYTWAGEPARGEALLAEYQAEVAPEVRRTQPLWLVTAAAIDLTRERDDEAIAKIRAWDSQMYCPICALGDLAWAYDRAGQPDSTIAIYERYVETPWLWRLDNDPFTLPRAYVRLGELYEEHGERDKALDYYNRFVELRGEADAELQPFVRGVRHRIARLAGEVSR